MSPVTHAAYVPEGALNTVTVLTPVIDADLALSTPAGITTDATGPAGATVSYPLPVVTDPDDLTIPAVSCTPAPGSVFAIGTTTVLCSAIDPDDANSPVTTSFNVTVNGRAAQLANLYQAVQGVGAGDSLADTVEFAQDQVAAGHTALVCLTLTGFIIEVRL